MSKQIFMGAGSLTAFHVNQLHELLDRAFIILGGIQQVPMSTDEVESVEWHNKAMEKGEKEVKLIAAEIYESLTGEKV